MDNITISITDENNNHIISPNELTRIVPADGLSIDNDKITGLDNFTIEAKRAKVTLRLLNQNQAVNNILKDVLTDEGRLIGMEQRTGEEFGCLVFDHNELLSTFNKDKLFYRHFHNMTQSWDQAATYGNLYVQSSMLTGIIFQCLLSFTKKINLKGSINNYNSDERTHSVDNLCCMFLAAFGIQQNIGITASNIDTVVTNYLNGIKNGYADMPHYGSILSLTYFLQTNHWQVIHNLAANAGYVLLENMIKQTANRLVRNNNYLTNFIMLDQNYNNVTLAKSNINGENDVAANCFCIALFLSSILRYDNFQELQNAYFNNGQDISRCTTNRYCHNGGQTYGIFVPFYNVKEVILSKDIHANSNWYEHTIIPYADQKYVSTKNRFLDSVNISKNILFCRKELVGSESRKLQFGKTQLMTNAETTDSGVATVIVGDIPTDDLFIPVNRKFKFRLPLDFVDYQYFYVPHQNLLGREYKFFIDNTKPGELFNYPESDSILKTGGWTDTNWMYFDYIFAEETILGPSAQTMVDNIPMFDIESGSNTDNYGLYIYRDYFEKFYIKEKSKFLNLYLSISIGETLLYTGIIDFTTVSIDRKSISFEATDAVGVLVENVSKLDDFVSFSQFDTGNNITANSRAGTTLKTFLETVIRHSLPYRTKFVNTTFEANNIEGLENKILTDISASDALVIAVQCCKKLLTANELGEIMLVDVFNGQQSEIDGEILSKTIKQNIDKETFDIEKLKKIAGYQKFTPEIVAYYMKIRSTYIKELQLEVYGQENEIKILDNIQVDNEMYVVTEKNVLFRSK